MNKQKIKFKWVSTMNERWTNWKAVTSNLKCNKLLWKIDIKVNT